VRLLFSLDEFDTRVILPHTEEIMALRGQTALSALNEERHNKWRKMIRNDEFRQKFNRLCERYAQWVNGPPLEVTVYEDDDFVDGDLDRKDAFLGTHRIVDDGEDAFLLNWAEFKAEYSISFPEQVMEQIRLGEFPRLEACPTETWDSLGKENNILPSPIIRLGEGLQDIPAGVTAFYVHESYQQSLVLAGLKEHLPRKTTRSRHAKLDVQLKLHDSSVKNGCSGKLRGVRSTTKSRLAAAKKAIGNKIPCLSKTPGYQEDIGPPEAPAEEQQDIQDAMAQLRPAEREAIQAIFYQSMTQEQHAANTQQSVSQVTALLASALSRLRPLMETKGYECPQDNEYEDNCNSDDKSYVLAPGCRRTPCRSYDRNLSLNSE
jgi:hypothetical protein